MLAKNLVYLWKVNSAGLVFGARVPIVLTSRADSVRSRMASCAAAVLYAAAHHKIREHHDRIEPLGRYSGRQRRLLGWQVPDLELRQRRTIREGRSKDRLTVSASGRGCALGRLMDCR